MECTVFTECGKYVVHFQSDGAIEFFLHVRDLCTASSEMNDHKENISTTSGQTLPLPLAYSASLTPEDVQAVTTRAGVCKTFAVFADMTYHALCRKSRCLTFHIETQKELERRIQEDARMGSAGYSGHSSSLPAASSSRTVSVKELPTCADFIDAQRNPSKSGNYQEDARCEPTSLFLTVDYSVDFTRGIFPLPLRRVPWVDVASFFSTSRTTSQPSASNYQSGFPSSSERSSKAEKDRSHQRLEKKCGATHKGEKKKKESVGSPSVKGNGDPLLTHSLFSSRSEVGSHAVPVHSISDEGSGLSPVPKNHLPVDRQHLAEALKLIDVLHKENATLKKENAMLARLSKEKMKEIRELCTSLEEGAVAIAEAKRLKNKNVQLRVEVEEAKEKAMKAFTELEALQRKCITLPSRTGHWNRTRGGSGRESSGNIELIGRRALCSSVHREEVRGGQDERSGRRRVLSAGSLKESEDARWHSRRRVWSIESFRGVESVRRSRLDTPTRPLSTGKPPRPSKTLPSRQEASGRPTGPSSTRHYDRHRLDTPPTRRCDSERKTEKKKKPNESGGSARHDLSARLGSSKDSWRMGKTEVGYHSRKEISKSSSYSAISPHHCLSSPGDQRTLPSFNAVHPSSGGRLQYKEGERSRRGNSSTSSSRCSSRSHERLFQMPTAASRERVLQQRADFQRSNASPQYTHARSRLVVTR